MQNNAPIKTASIQGVSTNPNASQFEIKTMATVTPEQLMQHWLKTQPGEAGNRTALVEETSNSFIISFMMDVPSKGDDTTKVVIATAEVRFSIEGFDDALFKDFKRSKMNRQKWVNTLVLEWSAGGNIAVKFNEAWGVDMSCPAKMKQLAEKHSIDFALGQKSMATLDPIPLFCNGSGLPRIGAWETWLHDSNWRDFQNNDFTSERRKEIFKQTMGQA
tara:strand:+ start:273 stop:926 length:654 start_codon:yes stop_codon:yes gene_type:complete